MSNAALDPPPFLFAQPGAADSPYAYTIATQGAIQPTAATATFDGSAAAGDFLACLSFYSQSGQLLSRVFPQTRVTAGDVAQVSYAPFPGGLASNVTPGSGINFDTDNQGGYLDITTNDPDPNTFGMALHDTTASGIDVLASVGGVQVVAASGMTLRSDDNGTTVLAAGAAGTLNLSTDSNGAGDVQLGAQTDGGVLIFTAGADGSDIVIQCNDGDVRISFAPTGVFQVNTGIGAVFRIDPDGALHGLTGQALTFDL